MLDKCCDKCLYETTFTQLIEYWDTINLWAVRIHVYPNEKYSHHIYQMFMHSIKMIKHVWYEHRNQTGNKLSPIYYENFLTFLGTGGQCTPVPQLLLKSLLTNAAFPCVFTLLHEPHFWTRSMTIFVIPCQKNLRLNRKNCSISFLVT